LRLALVSSSNSILTSNTLPSCPTFTALVLSQAFNTHVFLLSWQIPVCLGNSLSTITMCYSLQFALSPLSLIPLIQSLSFLPFHRPVFNKLALSIGQSFN